MREQILILFTKQFPFGNQEAYLYNELPYLIEGFKKVIIVPYEEFEYNETDNRIKNIKDIDIFCINKNVYSVSIFQKVVREIIVWNIFLFELVKGRDFYAHLKYIRKGVSQLRHYYTSALGLKDYLEKYKIHSLILYNYWLHGGVLISGIFSKLFVDKSLLTISRAHAYDVYHKDWYNIYPAAKYVFLGFETWKVYHSDIIFPISSHAYNHFIELFPLHKGKFVIERLGVINQYTYSQKKNLNIELQRDFYVIVSCSSIDGRKQIFKIPQIISLINKPVKWVHFGSGTYEDVEKVKQEIDKYKLNTICTLSGFVSNSEVLNYYRDNQVDLILNLSRIEGIPVALMEAASFGIPMVATKTVGNPEIVNNENGFLIDVDFNPSELADRLNNHFNNEQEISSKRIAARNTFLELYDASKNYPTFIKKIKELAQGFA